MVIASAAVVSGGLMAIKGPAFPATASGWTSVIAIALISTILAIVAFFAGLERCGANEFIYALHRRASRHSGACPRGPW